MPPRLTTEIFILRANKKHHGKFWQTPDSHARGGNGCDSCARDNVQITKPHTLDIFIAKARIVWGNRWDYSKVVYINNRNKVKIICPEHGLFKQTPDSHTQGNNGCTDCINAMLRAKYQSNNEEFVKKSVAYWAGQGCPSCTKYGFNPIAPARLYYLRVESMNQLCYKIGITNNELTGRYFGSDWDKITVLLDTLYGSGYEAKEEEDRIKEEFKAFKYTGEKLLIVVGITELFTKDVLLLDHHN